MMARSSVHSDDRNSAGGGRYHQDRQAGLPGLAPHDAISASFAALNPLRGGSYNNNSNSNNAAAAQHQPILQRLSGASNRHPLLLDLEPAVENCWTQSSCAKRSFMLLCATLLLILIAMMGLEIKGVLTESKLRREGSPTQGAAHWTVKGCHWTQIRLPSSLSTSDISIQEEKRGSGIGTLLLACACAEALNKWGAQRMYTEVDAWNDGAYSLYNRLGFQREDGDSSASRIGTRQRLMLRADLPLDCSANSTSISGDCIASQLE